MFASRRQGTVIAKGLKIVGSVAAEGLVEVNGQIDGELHCTSLIISRGAHVTKTVAAERVVVDGKVEGPIQGGDVRAVTAIRSRRRRWPWRGSLKSLVSGWTALSFRPNTAPPLRMSISSISINRQVRRHWAGWLPLSERRCNHRSRLACGSRAMRI
jgi:hypothetical protein